MSLVATNNLSATGGLSSSLRTSQLPTHTSLVRYDNPILVSTTKEGRGGAAAVAKRRAEEKQNLTPTEDILNSILPPRSVLLATKLLKKKHTSYAYREIITGKE